MLTTILLLLTVAYVPGALIFRLPIANREKRSALAAEERLFWAVMISVIVSTTFAFALAAAGIYSIRALAICNAILAAVLALASLGNLRLGPGARHAGWTAVAPAALVAACAWMYFATPAAEYVLGGRDPGVYMSQGIQIAQRQSLVTPDRTVVELPAEHRNVFFPPPHEDPNYYGLRFMGFHLRNPDTGAVSGQFPQGYPIWIAIAYGLDGVTGARRATGWWAILGVLAVYFATARLAGPLAAFATGGLLSVHVIQTWYARYPNSEIVTQALLFGALLAHAYAHQDDDAFFGPIAASLLGIALFTRLPVVLAIAVTVFATILGRANGERLKMGFLLTLAGWIATAGIYYTTHLRPYFNRPLEYLLLLQPIHLLALAAAGVSVCLFLLAIRIPVIAAKTRQWLPVMLVGAVSAGCLYAWLLREPGGQLAVQDAHALRMFVRLYVTPAALVLALLGYILVVWRSFWRAPALILTVTTFFFLFFYKVRIIPEHFWLTRRFVDLILPATLMFAAAGALLPLSRIVSQPFASRRGLAAARIVVGVVVTLLIAREYVSASERVRSHVEYAGLIPRLERLAERFGDDDLVLVEAREASDVHALALPLAYIYARNVLVLATSRPDKPAVVRLVNWALQRYKNVYFMAGGGTDLLSRGLGASVIESERFQIPEYEKTAYDVYPRTTLRKPFDFTIYQLLPSSSTAAPTTLDIGGADDLYLVGFYPKERLGGGDLTFRWTQDESHLLMSLRPESRQLVLKAQSGRPQGVAPAKMTVYLDGRELGTVSPTASFSEYTFSIPSEVASDVAQREAPADIRIVSSTWVPRNTSGGNDDRALGVMVDSAEIR